MTQLILVMTNLKRALRSVEGTPGIRKDFDEGGGEACSLLHYLPEIARLVAALEACDRSQCPAAWLDQSGKQRGIIDAHPEWAMLILRPEAECHASDAYWQHAGVVILCSVIQRTRHQARIGSEISLACRNIRDIGNGKKTLALLNEIEVGATLDRYRAVALLEDDQPIEGLAGIELLVRKVVHHKGKTREGGGGGTRSARLVERQVVVTDDNDEEREDPAQSVLLLESVGDEQTQSRQRMVGLHPKEAQTLRAVSFTESKASPTSGFDLRDLVRRQDSQVKHISQANQRLPYRYSSLSRSELALAAKAAFQLFTGRERFAQRDEEGVYAGLLLLLMIWLGRPVEQLLAMRVYAHRTELPQQRKGLLAFLQEEHAFVLPIPSPETRNSLQDDAKKLLYKAGDSTPALVDDVVIVASPVRIEQYISRLGLMRKPRTKYCELFPETQRAAIEGAMRAAVSKINRAIRMRLTPLRISQVLFDEIAQQSNEPSYGDSLNLQKPFAVTKCHPE
ncbi:hypothetical protein [Billgrantia antri]|uniref:hypothetical protein n=1 Tax=Billgrantia antri TaxID=2846777 RepID=UPI003B211DCD